MSDGVEIHEEAPAIEEVVEETSVTQSVRVMVADRMKGLGTEIIEELVKAEYEREKKKVLPAAAKVFELINEKKRRLKGLDRPDQVFRNRDSSIARQDFSEGRLKDIKKLEDEIRRLEEAWKDAFENGKYDKIIKAANSGGDNKDSETKA